MNKPAADDNDNLSGASPESQLSRLYTETTPGYYEPPWFVRLLPRLIFLTLILVISLIIATMLWLW